jgi:dihydrofolate reductase
MSAPHEIALIVAMDQDGWIGRDGQLLWHLPDDLKHFKQLTLGQPVIMGRKTCESLGRRPLPGRKNIVLTRQAMDFGPGFAVAHDAEAALALASAELDARAPSAQATPQPSSPAASAIWIIGGAEIYALFLPQTTRMEITRVEAHVRGDVRFPAVPWHEWSLSTSSAHAADERHIHPFHFETWLRASPAPR